MEAGTNPIETPSSQQNKRGGKSSIDGRSARAALVIWPLNRRWLYTITDLLVRSIKQRSTEQINRGIKLTKNSVALIKKNLKRQCF
jgi:hypothetical protein